MNIQYVGEGIKFMLDVCFDPSLGGMLIINRFNPELGEPGRDVVTLELYMDVGDLSDGVFSEKRKKAAAGLFKDQWLGKRSFVDKRHWDATINNLEIIRSRAVNGELIRIWYGPDADSCSSFLWLVSELQSCNAKISAVAFSDLAYELEPHCYNWVRTDLEDLALLAQAERAITHKQQANILLRWKNICASTLPLRIVLNGHVISVNEDYYDCMILESLPDEPFVPGYAMNAMMESIPTDLPYYFINRRMCDLFREYCDIVEQKKTGQGYLFDRLVFQKKMHPLGEMLPRRVKKCTPF